MRSGIKWITFSMFANNLKEKQKNESGEGKGCWKWYGNADKKTKEWG